MERPKGFENEKSDCTVRALSLASNIPYEEVHMALKKSGRRNRCSVKDKSIFKAIDYLGLKKTQVKRSGSLGKFIKQFPKGTYYCHRSTHAFVVIDGVAHGEEKMGVHIKGAWKISKKFAISGVGE